MHRKSPISPTAEMYLKVLYRMQQDSQVARVRDIAEKLGVSPGTVSGTLKKLESQGLVDHERYGFPTLTEEGLQTAESVLDRYEILRDVLIEIFGLDRETAREDACLMEHAVGGSTVDRMRSALERFRAGKLAPAAPATKSD